MYLHYMYNFFKQKLICIPFAIRNPQPRKLPGRKLFGFQLITRLIPMIPLLLVRK